MDVHDKATRSYNMSRIKSKNTKPEMIVRKFLHANGFRYRLHVNDLPGKPDIVLPKYRTVIFVNGCFWHGHEGCRYATIPKTRSEWWEKKINNNIKNDETVRHKLKIDGWKVINIWQCSIKRATTDLTLAKLLKLNTQ